MKRSTAFDFADGIQGAAKAVTEGTSSFSSEYLAGQYAFDAALEAGDGLQYEDLVFHLQCLAEAGAEFDSGEAVKIAQRFVAAHEFD